MPTETLFEIPEAQSNIIGNGLEVLPESENFLKGKLYKWKFGPYQDEITSVKQLVRKNTTYSVVLDNGQILSMNELESQLYEVDKSDELNIRPNQQSTFRENINTFSERQPEPIKQFDPVHEILNKRKKTNPVSITIKFTSSDIPTKELYNLLKDSYDDAEDKIIDYLFNSENIQILKNDMKQAIRLEYNIIDDNDE